MTCTPRKLIKAAIEHRNICRIPVVDAIWPETLENWRQQGYPEDIDPIDYFDFDMVNMYLDCSPRFEQRIVQDIDDKIIYEDRYGYTASYERHKVTMDFIAHKTESKEAWENSKDRWKFIPDEEARIDSNSYFRHFDRYPSWQAAKDIYDRLYATGKYLIFHNYGPWEAAWRHHGYTNMLMDVELEPEMVEEMAAAHHNMTLSVLEHCLKHGMKPDGYFMIEDLAHNRGMLFSPASWRNILKPYYKELGLFLQANDINFLMHCCGNAEVIFADLIEAGVQVMQPLQVSAGMNVVNLRQKYQDRLAFWGNIDIRKLSDDDDFWFNEALPKINLAESGGYVYHSDHSVPCNIDFNQYKKFIDKIKAVRFC